MTEHTSHPYREIDVERFWDRVTKTDACWLYTGSMSNGYGRHNTRRGKIAAHRFVWQITHGPIPDGLEVCHSCDTRNCVRPDHLWLGTHLQNMEDMRRKGRRTRGEALPFTKMTDAQVAELRSRYKRTGHRVSNINALADEYGISPSHAKSIVSGRRR